MNEQAQTLTYRPSITRVCFGIYLVYAVWWLSSVSFSADGVGVALRLAPWLVAVGAVLYGVLWRPAVIVSHDGVLLRNIIRDVVVPWPALETVETRYALTLIAADRRYASWAAAAPGRPMFGSRSAGVAEAGAAPPSEHGPASRSLRADSGAAAFMVEHAWHNWQGRTGAQAPMGTVTVRWNRPLIALSVLSLLTGAIVG